MTIKKSNLKIVILLSVIIIGGGWYLYNNQKTSAAPASQSAGGEKKTVTVYKTTPCGCCGNYVTYLKRQGFEVKEVNMNDADLTALKKEQGVPAGLTSCHTTVVDNYFLEGHMPVEAINKLIADQPDLKGIALPGMPPASPGMPGIKSGSFVIYGVDASGQTTDFVSL